MEGLREMKSSQWCQEAAETEQAPPQSTSGRVTSPPDAGGLSAQSGVSLESVSNSSATSTANGSCGVSSNCDVNGAGKQSAALPATESRRLAEYIPGPERQYILGGRTRGEERYRHAPSPQSLMPAEDDIKIVLYVEEEVILEEAFTVDREVSVEMPFGKVKDLPPPLTT